MISKWVLIDESNGAQTGDGDTLNPAKIALIAAAVEEQLNDHFSTYYGGFYQVRAGANPSDVKADETVISCVPAFKDIPNASAYHDNVNGKKVAYIAVTTCSSAVGPNGVAQDASHELIEAEANPACNLFADDGVGNLHAREPGDPVEIQSYTIEINGIPVYVSNFVLPSWFNPQGSTPYDYMTSEGLPGAIAPSKPFQLASSPDGQGNYQIVETDSGETQIFGNTRKDKTHAYSRFTRIKTRKGK